MNRLVGCVRVVVTKGGNPRKGIEMSVSLEVIPTGTVGAEVKGVDLAAVTGAEVEAIKRAWYEHDVLVFRKQKLTDDDLLAFSRHFGALDPPPNQGAGRKSPPGYPGGYVRKGMAASEDPRTSVGTPHPIVVRHPVSGEKALYLGRRRNAYIMGLDLAESEQLLDEIWSYVDAAVYKHKWASGDLVLWDNRTTMHRRDAFDPKARRVMHRTQIKGSGAPARAVL